MNRCDLAVKSILVNIFRCDVVQDVDPIHGTNCFRKTGASSLALLHACFTVSDLVEVTYRGPYDDGRLCKALGCDVHLFDVVIPRELKNTCKATKMLCSIDLNNGIIGVCLS